MPPCSISHCSFRSQNTGTALLGYPLPCPQPRLGLQRPSAPTEERQVSPRQGKGSCLGPCLLSKMSQQQQRLVSVRCCIPDHSTLQGCTCSLSGAAPPCPPLSLPASLPCLGKLTRYLVLAPCVLTARWPASVSRTTWREGRMESIAVASGRAPPRALAGRAMCRGGL